MYDSQQILASVDAHIGLFLALGTVTMLFNYGFFITAIINGNRDRAFPFALLACTIWFAHDISYLLMFHTWFGTYHHWYLELFWAALIPTSTIEAIYIFQVWRFGKEELMPKSSQSAFNFYILAAVAAGMLGWFSVKSFLADPIYVYTFGCTGYLGVVTAIPRLLRRRDAAGQSVAMWVCFIFMQTGWFSTTALLFGPAFQTPLWFALWFGCVAGGAFMVAACRTLKPATALAPRGLPQT
jgi:hypothetical protein